MCEERERQRHVGTELIQLAMLGNSINYVKTNLFPRVINASWWKVLITVLFIETYLIHVYVLANGAVTSLVKCKRRSLCLDTYHGCVQDTR